ncbi:t-SNARE [Coemansia reversa NRRL 1564]|uniref:t-SNARE n=1 Tax=Coemansia reversa (strain ATCC 12441 / NRRL 1564) TaxID=763665 RepID=A0A2G5B5C8_COERN|nr:t-SNARE [Coemansia reversa NRRL 1564]|eukprot:PIA14201.1 t-SNARE [Coemansia reversa NRRL 1564]
MSFNDLERGTYAQSSPDRLAANRAGAGLAQSEEERNYKRTVQELSRKVFQINASVANIRQLVGQLGTSRDTARLRQDIHNKMETSRELVKATSTELKSLSEFQANTSEARRRARRLEQQKLTADFQKVLEQFQNIQRVSAEITREFVDRAKHAVQAQTDPNYGQEEEYAESTPLLGGQQQQQQQQRRVELAVLDNDIEYNEALINERESEINEIEQGIVELNEIFRDMGTIVTEQQSLLDNIETNVQSVAVNALGASEELNSASEYQRRSNKTKFCILLFAIIFIIVLLLVALS